MAFDFPNAPAEGAIYSPPGGPQYQFTSGVWKQVAATGEVLNIVQTVITSSQTYTKPAGLKFLEVTVIGGGGGVPGAPLTPAGNASASTGAGGGGAASKLFAGADVPASVSMTVGAPGNGTPTSGGSSIFAGLTGGGGNVGSQIAASTVWGYAGGAAGGVGSGGDMNVPGGTASMGGRYVSSGVLVGEGGAGGGSLYAPALPSVQFNATINPANGIFPGGGARGACNGASQAATIGASGGAGCIILKEYF